MSAGSVTTAVEVAVDPATAFEVFTAEVDAWYRRDRFTLYDVARTAAVRFEPWVGGRLLEVHDAVTGEGHEMGRITAWEPARRLAFTDARGTEVEVTFTPAPAGTRVTLEHRGLDRLPPGEAAHVRRYGWGLLLPWFGGHVATRIPPPPLRGAPMSPTPPVTFEGVTPYLYYADGAAALAWLADVFGFTEEVRYLGPTGAVEEAELRVGATRIMLSGRAPDPDNGAGQLLIVHLDDVQAQYDRVTAAGVAAKPPEDKPYGPRTFNVVDPWGYRWDFWQMVSEVQLAEGWQEVRP
jgi:uncharacterized glyoxalase superfamily protein PhnB/uncharacterized protein YndB with AHSA1/START domain